jgi:hypothetical protein
MPENPIATPTAAYLSDESEREMLRFFRRGPEGVKDAGIKLLPKLDQEPPDKYNFRLSRAYPSFFNATERAVRSAVGKVFSREVKLGDDVPPKIAEFCEDVDLAGNNLHNFMYTVFEDAWWDGVGFFLVDMQTAPAYEDAQGNVRPPTRAEVTAANLRPFFKKYDAKSLIGFRAAAVNGEWRLTQARLAECVEVEDGDYGSRSEHRIRVFYSGNADTKEPASYEVWTMEKSTTTGETTWTQSQPRSALLGMYAIPLVPVYTGRTDFMRGKPPFLNLGYLNMAHYQLTADLRHIEYVANVPLPYVTGADASQYKSIPWGPHNLAFFPAGAQPSYWEHSGKSIGELKDTLRTTHGEMDQLSLEPSQHSGTTKAVQQTATGEQLRASEAHSRLQLSALGLKDATERGLGYMGEWIGLGVDAGGSVDVETKFFISQTDGPKLQWLTAARNRPAGPDISRETTWSAVQDLDVLPEDFDPDVEAERLAAEEAMQPPSAPNPFVGTTTSAPTDQQPTNGTPSPADLAAADAPVEMVPA